MEAKSKSDRVAEAVNMYKQLQKMGVMSNPRFAQQFKDAYQNFVHDGTSTTVRCPAAVGSSVVVTFSTTRQSGVTLVNH